MKLNICLNGFSCKSPRLWRCIGYVLKRFWVLKYIGLRKSNSIFHRTFLGEILDYYKWYSDEPGSSLCGPKDTKYQLI